MKYVVFGDFARYLKRNLPLSHSVQVRRVKLSDELEGDCQFKKNKFIIRINNKLVEEHAIEVLMHEISHAMSWHTVSWDTEKDIHGLKWGRAYSLVYGKYLEWLSLNS